ncbi:MAG: type II secretion system protein [Bacteriovoracia bacterium]
MGAVKKIAQAGFTLMEVMIALSIFAFFITAFMVGFGSNLSDSTMMDEENMLRQLCEEKIAQLELDPPDFVEGLTLTADTGNFSEEGYPDYEYIIKYKRLKIPDLNAIQGKEEDAPQEENAKGQLESMVFQKMRENIEKIIWQAEVTVKNKNTDFNYTLTTWLTNHDAQVKLNF